jgi:hypothetical protein
MTEAAFDVHADLTKNRLYITLIGFFDDVLMEKACAKIGSEAKRLRKDFSIITDISKCRPATQKGAGLIQQVQTLLAKLGVGRVVRVTSRESQIIKFQFERRSEGLYQAESAASTEEAERRLDSGA